LTVLNIVECQKYLDCSGFLCHIFGAEEFADAVLLKPIAHFNQNPVHKQGMISGMDFKTSRPMPRWRS
jgi:hypothetical protein